MTSSRSKTSTNRWLALLVVLVGWAVLDPTVAHAGRKRVVVLELDGPKAEKFHGDLVKLIKKSHTVVPVDKWNGAAEDLDATKLTEKDVKKVAKKLKVDAVISGKVDKRRDEYIIQLKVREGKSGELVGSRIDVKAEGASLAGDASRDLKDELIPLINDVESNRSGGFGGSKMNDDEEEEEDRPSKKSKKDDEEEEEEEEEDKPKKLSKKEEAAAKKQAKKEAAEEAKRLKEEEKKAKALEAKEAKARKDEETAAALKTKKDKASKKDADEEDEDDSKSKRTANKDEDEEEEDEDEDEDGDRKKKKKVASSDGDEDDDEDEGDGIEEEGEVEGLDEAAQVAPGERAIDLVAGLSFNARRMSFSYNADLGDKPQPYKGVPVAGALLDATFYPLAFGHKRRDMLKNLGVTVMYDKVLKIQSKQGNPAVTLPTSQARYAVGVAFRYPLGKALTVGATLRYGRQSFTISPAMGVTPGLPNVEYTIIDPSLSLKIQAAAKIIFNIHAGFMLIPGTGPIQKNDAYGAATVTGFEGEIGGDYMLTSKIFARAAFKFEIIGYKFKGTGMLSNMRDQDPEQDVFGASDKYLGGAVTVGVLY